MKKNMWLKMIKKTFQWLKIITIFKWLILIKKKISVIKKKKKSVIKTNKNFES